MSLGEWDNCTGCCKIVRNVFVLFVGIVLARFRIMVVARLVFLSVTCAVSRLTVMSFVPPSAVQPCLC